MTILLFITWHKNNFIAGIVYQISQHSAPRQQCIGPVSALAVQLIQERGFSNSLWIQHTYNIAQIRGTNIIGITTGVSEFHKITHINYNLPNSNILKCCC